MDLIFDKSIPGRRAYIPPENGVARVDAAALLPAEALRKTPPNLPEISELDLVRHFTNLSRLNMGVDTNFYPLGSCTMKYNPKFSEYVSRLPGFTRLHPETPPQLCQGILELLYETAAMLSDICGMSEFSLQPAAGAHGELAGMLIVRAYFKHKKQNRNVILIPDSAHGTNPASAALAGFTVAPIPTKKNGLIDTQKLKTSLTPETACLMMTNPNTLGLFEEDISEVSALMRRNGSLLYYDGANLNALLGKARPGDMGFDIVHLNLHKTFATPHGGGGPGSGPVGVCEMLKEFLPSPVLKKDQNLGYYWSASEPLSIGRLKSYYGNIGVIIKAYAYIKALGGEGLEKVSENAVLNANYLLKALKSVYDIPFPNKCMHEFVISAVKQKEAGVRAIDIAKALLDKGIHAPTVYFPLIVAEALMIEPTETESKQTLDNFIKAMLDINAQVTSNKESLTNAPQTLPVSRPDEVQAARKPKLKI